MMHANKMILVPHEMIGENESSSKHLYDLDNEMLKILKDKNMPEDIKMVHYSQILHRHRIAAHKQNEPFQLEIKEASEPRKISDEIKQTIIATVPKKWHKQASMLLDYANNTKSMTWSDNRELIVNGNKIKGSNIVDLINDLSRDRKKMEPAVGVEVFLKKLLEENIPREIVVNKKRFELLEQPTYYAHQVGNDDMDTSTQSGAGLLRKWKTIR